MAKTTDTIWRVNEIDIPVRVVQEWRKSNRIAINKDKVILRVPIIGGTVLKESSKAWAINWISQQLCAHPEIKKRFLVKEYQSGDLVNLPNKTYRLKLLSQERKTSMARLIDHDTIEIKYNNTIREKHKRSKTIGSLVSRIVGQDQLLRVTHRIAELNDQFFQECIERVRLKNNKSNWGSCSSSGNINISTRTLLAPLEVQDYVFVHELAHLKELNHSAKYWSLVESVMPNYKEHETWLKTYGHTCSY